MANSPVLQLQELASSSDSDILEVLLKAKIISVKLNLNEITDWIENEINGYPTRESTPDYRQCRAPLKAFNPFRGWIPVDLGSNTPQDIKDLFNTACFTESISSIQLNANSEKSLRLPLPESMAEFLYEGSDSPSKMELAWMISSGSMLNIISNVKARIVDWTLELEKKGILGEGLVFSLKEKEVATAMTQNIYNITGNITNSGVFGANNHDITQNNNVSSGNLESLIDELKKIGLVEEDIQELNSAIQNDIPPATPESFGSQTSAWIGKVVGKAYAGSLKIPGAVAAGVITRLLCSYYGIA
ncbi:abortive phage resistance protein [Salmonella enterica subsp. houtenae]|nr:abortive phage resistance protein [Salmonella enterica subsp. houtenae]ECD9323740.1 abortive phage resistance protein [Salmonella enterica subsp. houtenae]ECJ2522549.1 abortive phage resistance protein [Salmonella enterica subsp. houtenae]EDS2902838.1 abortive phage resistance protein [Salmonella enterica subsp. houtenae]EDX5630949.1 abortive phage resistance protein [Salmonella enterica subsp. houtenae]